MKVEITEQQYNQLQKTGVSVEQKFYLVVDDAKTRVACAKKGKRRSPLDIVRLNKEWGAIALSTERQETMAAAVADTLNHEGLGATSKDLADKVSDGWGISYSVASGWVSKMIKAGVLTVD